MPEALERVSGIIRAVSASQNPTLFEGLREIFGGDGKLLRPGLLLLSSGFGKPDWKKQENLAAALEMLHVSTLIHDDVIDDSPMRRGLPAAHERYGKRDAVLMGDYLLSRCFLLTSEYTSPESAVNLAKVISIICTQEIEQNSRRFQADITVRGYLRQIMGKTATLFSLACHVGAHESRAPEAVTSRLRRAGYNIGMAFQVIDDILDYAGVEEKVRKPLGNDLKEGVVTLPLICALSLDETGELRRLTSPENFAQAARDQIISLVGASGGLDEARAYARLYTGRALREIAALPKGQGRDSFDRLARRLLVRDY
jgi:heptaprenyl diphosphate synthase